MVFIMSVKLLSGSALWEMNLNFVFAELLFLFERSAWTSDLYSKPTCPINNKWTLPIESYDIGLWEWGWAVPAPQPDPPEEVQQELQAAPHRGNCSSE